MPKLINSDGTIGEDNWHIVEAGADIPSELAKGFAIIPLADFLSLSDEDVANASCGVWLGSADDVSVLSDTCKDLPIIAFHFDNFMDGRNFSSARLLHDHLDYQGDIRAVGSYIQDQLFYLSRCGFKSFAIADDADTDSMIKSLQIISESYQAGTDEPQPLFRRRT